MAAAGCASLTTLPAALSESTARPQALVSLASLLPVTLFGDIPGIHSDFLQVLRCGTASLS